MTMSSRRIELGVCRVGDIVQGNVRGDATEQSQNMRLPVTTAIMGTVSLSIFTSSSRPPIYISTHNKSDRVLRQFGFRKPILVASEVFDDEHKVDLRQLHMDWPRFWSHYIEMWENQYDYIPTREPIIVPELACVVEYMPWFRIHGKPYLLSKEERRR
ncbi:hypothetical protein PVK06_006923 [Gossypium arboreum]|uniref:Uncharacterized protein n=1 Tax=Gossypium arboreum TaxID=29729 RepID=A0ABR0QFW6_GOSAR|nr:hypothetical protein PVK06_006923 [Gossypium arboreum]